MALALKIPMLVTSALHHADPVQLAIKIPAKMVPSKGKLQIISPAPLSSESEPTSLICHGCKKWILHQILSVTVSGCHYQCTYFPLVSQLPHGYLQSI